jgi:chromosomal replication initiator protein
MGDRVGGVVLEAATSTNVWEEVLDRIQRRVSAHSFSTWFKPTTFMSEDESCVHVRVPNTWFAEWLRTNYFSIINDALVEIGRPGIGVRFVPEVERGRRPPLPARRGPSGPPADRSPGPTRRTFLNPRYTFDAFVVSSCNEFASAAALAVAEQPTRVYNPLFVYGGVGLGKTHLMQAIGNHLSREGRVRMRYISAEQFMNELINAIRFEHTPEFKDTFRNVDLLLIEDIQFLAGKERTQEEFFHTFNALYDSQKQIVITSDCPPREIGYLEERLRSRFEWGLIADIQAPDLETKVAILKKKAEAEDASLPDDVALFIASKCKSNIRELEGALIRVIAFASMSGREISLDVAKETLQELLEAEAPAVTVESIQKMVANHFNLKVSELKSRNNSHHISFPRQIAMYLCKLLTDASLPETGRRFGGKHHSTVIHAIRKIENKRSKDSEFDRQMETFIQALK